MSKHESYLETYKTSEIIKNFLEKLRGESILSRYKIIKCEKDQTDPDKIVIILEKYKS